MRKAIGLISLSFIALGLANCNKNNSITSGSDSNIVAIIKDTLKNDPVIKWEVFSADSVLFQDSLTVPTELENNGTDEIAIHIRAFKNKFHRLLDSTWVLGYVPANTEYGKERLPGPTIETTNGKRANVTWVNQLQETIQDNPAYGFPGKSLKYYPLIYDTRKLDDVDPGAAIPMIINSLYPATIAEPAMGHTDPIMAHSTYYATAVHLHGANLAWKSDGHPASSTIERAGDMPKPIEFGLFGPYESNKQSVHYSYPNTFPEANYDTADTTQGGHGAILWYHDHSIMRTVANVYMGLAGAYLIEGVGEDSTRQYYLQQSEQVRQGLTHVKKGSVVKLKKDITEIPDIPLLISDKMFTKKGRLYYESKRIDGERQPEFFGNTITVNGKAWPYFDVKRQLYRFRILNTSSSRFYRIALARWKNGEVNLAKIDTATFVQIGTEGGPLVSQVGITPDKPIMLAPGERVDVHINFSEFSNSATDSLVLLNLANDAPYQEVDSADNIPIDSVKAAAKKYTNFILQFRVQPQQVANRITNKELTRRVKFLRQDSTFQKLLYKLDVFSNQHPMRRKSLSRSRMRTAMDSLPAQVLDQLDGSKTYRVHSLSITEASDTSLLPTPVKRFYKKFPEQIADLPFPMAFLNESEWNIEANKIDSNTEPHLAIKQVSNNTNEIWAITNYTSDTHPIHIHLNRFRILGRRDSLGQFIDKEPQEKGWKDVVRVKPNKFTTYIWVTYALSNDEKDSLAQFVYHCHILEHEDVSMMRRLLIENRAAVPEQQRKQAQIKPTTDKFNIPVCYGVVGLLASQTQVPTRKSYPNAARKKTI